MGQGFLPICKEDMEKRGWTQLDFVYVSGDAYVDHPSFGHAIITRILEAYGYKVGIIAQPDWKDKNSMTIFGEPRLGFLVSAGNMDSMVNHYYCIQEAETERMHIRRVAWPVHRPDYATDRLRQSDPSDLQAYADHPGRNRSKSPENGTL